MINTELILLTLDYANSRILTVWRALLPRGLIQHVWHLFSAVCTFELQLIEAR